MKSIIFGVVVIQLMFVVSTFAQDFDFFYFVVQWPGGYCEADKAKPCCYDRDPATARPMQDFRIIGLRPSYKNGALLSNCKNAPFDQNKLTGILPLLKTHWRSLDCPKNDGMSILADAWNKHGKCSKFDQITYFRNSLILRGLTNVFQALSDFGFKTQDLETYSRDMITDAIKKYTGHAPHLECSSDGVRSQLYNVYFCVDKSGKTLIECPTNPKEAGNCGTAVEWPDFW